MEIVCVDQLPVSDNVAIGHMGQRYKESSQNTQFDNKAARGRMLCDLSLSTQTEV